MYVEKLFWTKHVTMLQLSIIQRLPQNYRWMTGFTGSKVEPVFGEYTTTEDSLIGLKLLSNEGDKAWHIMNCLSLVLGDIDVSSAVVECDGEPCLFVDCQDELAATCRLKNCGIAIAEPVSEFSAF